MFSHPRYSIPPSISWKSGSIMVYHMISIYNITDILKLYEPLCSMTWSALAPQKWTKEMVRLWDGWWKYHFVEAKVSHSIEARIRGISSALHRQTIQLGIINQTPRFPFHGSPFPANVHFMFCCGTFSHFGTVAQSSTIFTCDAPVGLPVSTTVAGSSILAANFPTEKPDTHVFSIAG